MVILGANRMTQRNCTYLYELIISHNVQATSDLDRLPDQVKGFIQQKLPDLITFNNTVGACWRISATPQAKGMFCRQWITAQVRKAINYGSYGA